MKNPFSGFINEEVDGDGTLKSVDDHDRNIRNHHLSPCSSSVLNACNPESPLRSPGEYDPDGVRMDKDLALHCLEDAEEKILSALTDLTNKTGMPITQENGQRRYGPPLNYTSVPPRGSEIFVGKLPRDCYEPEIIPIFEKMGRVYELRLMMDFSGTNRGYCFVHYFTPADAERAVKELNNYEIRKGRHIGVVKSVDNCRLFIGGIPMDKDETEIRTEMNKLTVGVVKVIIHSSNNTGQKNRGFAFVEFENHKAAASARRKLMPGKLKMWGIDIAVDWAEPEEEIQVLFVRNLKLTTSEQVIKRVFDDVSENGVQKVNKVKDFAFVHFLSHVQAEMAKTAMENSSIEDSEVQVHWSKSSANSKRGKKAGNKIRIEFDTSKSCLTPSPWIDRRNQSGGNFRYGNVSNITPFPNYGPYYGWYGNTHTQLPPTAYNYEAVTKAPTPTAYQYTGVTFPNSSNYTNQFYDNRFTSYWQF